MKTKLILLLLLSLFAVQGWASPVDSLETHNPKNLIHGELSGLNLSDNFNRLNGLDGLTVVDKTKGKVVADADWGDLLGAILAATPIINIEEVDESENFNGITVGSSATKKFRIISGENLLGYKMVLKYDYVFLDLLHSEITNVTDYGYDVIYHETPFSASPCFISISDIIGGNVEFTVTYNPTIEGPDSFDFYAYLEHGMTSSNGVGAIPALVVMPGLLNGYSGSAVERTITSDKSSISFLNLPIDETRTEHFTVTGKNLTGPLTLSLSGIDKELFDVNPKTISAECAIEGAEVTVNYHPISSGNHSALVTISGGGAYPEETVGLIGSTGTPRFSVDSTSLSFPNATVGYPESKHFTITGSYLTGPLHLNVEDSGTHGHFSIDQDKCEISAAQVAEGVQVTVYYTPTDAGSLSGRITISGGSAETKTILLSGSAQEPPRIIVDNNSLEFTNVKVGESEPKTFRVTGTNLTGDLTLTVDESDGDQFTIDKKKITAAEAANGVNVTVTYTPTEEGTHSGRVLISGGGAESKGVSLSGSAQEPPRIIVDKTSVTFNSVTVGKPVTETFKVKGTNLTGDLTLTKEESDGNQFTIDKKKITAAQAASWVTVTVTYMPTEEGTHSGRVLISGGGAESKSVSLSGSAKERIITTSESTLNFGKVAKGKSKTKTFTVKAANLTGDLSLELTGTNKDMYTISPVKITPSQAASANGATVSVTYSPTAKASHSAKITISGGDALSSKTVDLTGQCVIPSISVSKTKLDFGDMDAGATKTLSFTVTGTDLTEGISLIVASTDSHADFSITPTSLGSNANGATVKVTCTANIAGSISGRVTISSKDAVSKTVDLTGTVKCYITTSPSSLSYSPSSLNKSFKVTCVGANTSLKLEKTGTDASYFTLGTTSISMDKAREGKWVSVACVPKTKDHLSAKIKITGGGADYPKYVTLSYSNGVVSISSVQPDGDSEGGNEEYTNGGTLEAFENTTDVNELAINSKIYAEGQNIIIESPVEQSAIISDISGHAQSVNLQIGRNEIPVNASGIFIVRIREKTTKLMLK